MKYKIITIYGVFASFCLFFGQLAHAQLAAVSGPISGYHGNPSNCTSCHADGAYTASATLSGPTTVLHGQNSSTFTLAGSGGVRRGFNIAIYRVTDNVKQTTGFNTLSAGIYTPNFNGELQHGVAQNIGSWTFRWNAPATLGSYRVYACVNPVNNMGDQAGDGNADCDTHNFSVTNNNPNAVNDTNAVTVSEGSGLSAQFNVLTNDLTTEGDSFSWFSTTGAGSVTGTLTDNSNGTYRYNPDGLFNYLSEGQVVTTTFDYTIEEDSYAGYRDTATATIRISGVNDRPTAVNDGTPGAAFVTVQEGMEVDNGTDGDAGNNDLAANDTDPDTNDTLDATRTGCTGGVTDPANGTITNFGADGTFTYTHNGSDTTTDSFTYCTIDSSGTGTARSTNKATVYIQITPINDKPEAITSAGNTAFTEQTPVVVDSNLTLQDDDSTQFLGASVQITGNAQPGDQLACGALPVGISCSAPGTTITLSSAATAIANYKTALEAVTFTSSSDNPDLGARTVTFILEDDLSAFSDPIASAQKTISPISRTNDSPTLATITPPILDAEGNNAYEDTAGNAFTFNITAVASDIDSNDDVNDGTTGGGSGSLVYSLIDAPAGMSISNDNANPGLITWNPPITGTFDQVYGPITVQVVDGGENGAVAATQAFSLTVSPPDTDEDDVAEYNDFCPGATPSMTSTDATNADFDGDGTAGMDSDPYDDVGGDVCDIDDDGDTMPDAYEIANSLNPYFDDSALDADGDGFSNLEEFNNGTNPNLTNLAIDATGYLTPYDLVPPLPSSIHADATAVTPVFAASITPVSSDPYGPYRPGNNTVEWVPSNATETDLRGFPGLVTDPPEQTLFIRPLVSIDVDQQVEEATAGAVTITIRLNGDVPSWPANPAEVDYEFSGSAGALDYTTLATGTATFVDGDYEEDITINVLPDGVSDPNETVVVSLTAARGAAIGSSASHTVTIVEENLAPRVELQFSQGAGVVVGSTYTAFGDVTIEAVVSDANNLSYDWSGSDNALVPPVPLNEPNWTRTPAAGNYLIDVIVTDDGVPSKSTRVTRLLNVSAAAAPATLANLADADGDGIPLFLDTIDGAAGGGNLVPDQTTEPDVSLLLETDPGLTLRRGDTAQAAGQFGALLTDTDIENFGSSIGSAPLYSEDSFDHVGGIYDFTISGLVPGSSARIVIPLQSAIPRNGRYRKFHPDSGWSNFVEDSRNTIASAAGELGACPEPGSSAYRSGMNYLDNCVELTIEDGGPNDTDNAVNGIVNDPSSVGTRLSDPEVEEVKGGSGRIPLLLLVLLLMVGGLACQRRLRRSRID